MERTSIFNKMKNTIAVASESGLDKLNISKKSETTSDRTMKTVKNEIAHCQDEFSKLMNVIGREAFDLFQKGNLTVEQLEGYFSKATNINEQISNLVIEKEVIEKANQKYIICACGLKNPKNIKFCPNCGSATLQNTEEIILCICGATFATDQDFCMECGRLKE